MPEPQTRAVADNLCRAMQFFGRARKSGEVQEQAGVCIVSCGLNYAAFNAAVLTETVGADSRELMRRIQRPASFYNPRNLRWTYWVCDDYLDKPLRREANNVFARCGLRPLTEAPGMYAEQLSVPARLLPVIDVRPVVDEATRTAFAWITSTTFDIPHAICSAIYGGEQAWTGDFKGYVGYLGGQAITTTAVIVAAGVIGFYSVATLADYRRFGYAEATMRKVYDQVKQESGIEHTVLQATRSGYGLYERMGYRRITNFSVYVTN